MVGPPQSTGLDLRRVVPHRNLLLLSLAASYAAGLKDGASHVALCINQDDVNTYSSSSTAFLRHADALLAVGGPLFWRDFGGLERKGGQHS